MSDEDWDCFCDQCSRLGPVEIVDTEKSWLVLCPECAKAVRSTQDE